MRHTSSGAERRRAPRVPAALRATVVDLGLETASTVVNVSTNGACVLVAEPIKPWTKMRIRIEFGSAQSVGEDFPSLRPQSRLRRPARPSVVTVEAAVIWCCAKPGGMHEVGLLFLDVSDRIRATIARFVAGATRKRRAVPI